MALDEALQAQAHDLMVIDKHNAKMFHMTSITFPGDFSPPQKCHQVRVRILDASGTASILLALGRLEASSPTKK
jgi:hypothetical protein